MKRLFDYLNDGLWHNVCPHAIDVEDADLTFALRWFWLAICVGRASARGWVEVEGSWVRLTTAGRAALKGEK